MRRLRRFFSLEGRDRILLVRALAWVAFARAALTLMPFRRVRAGVRRFARRGATRRGDRERIGWAVETVASLVPGATCLTQALAAHVLLKRDGHDSELRIGVARPPDGRLEAHAWVESDGAVVVGDHDLHRFAPLEGSETA